VIRSVGVSSKKVPFGVVDSINRPLDPNFAGVFDSAVYHYRVEGDPSDHPRLSCESQGSYSSSYEELERELYQRYGSRAEDEFDEFDFHDRGDSPRSRGSWDPSASMHLSDIPEGCDFRESRSHRRRIFSRRVNDPRAVEKLYRVPLDSSGFRLRYPKAFRKVKYLASKVHPMEYFTEMGNPHCPLLIRAELLSLRSSLSLIRETRNEALTRIRSGLSCKLQHKTLRYAFSVSLKGATPLRWRGLLHSYVRASLRLLKYAHWDLQKFGLDQADLRCFNEVPTDRPQRGWFNFREYPRRSTTAT